MYDDEAKLVADLKARSELAFAELVRAHQAPIYRLVLRLLGGDASEAEDVAQEVFLTAFKAIEGFRGESLLSTWLYRIAINHARNRQKYRGRRQHGWQQELDDSAVASSSAPTMSSAIAGPEELLEGRQTAQLLERALAELDTEQRALVVLRDLEELSYQDVQRITGLPEGTVKSRLHCARVALQRSFTRLQRLR
jgi:RNA polymerase sigma-70 factor (ECF subfamily)